MDTQQPSQMQHGQNTLFGGPSSCPCSVSQPPPPQGFPLIFSLSGDGPPPIYQLLSQWGQWVGAPEQCHPPPCPHHSTVPLLVAIVIRVSLSHCHASVSPPHIPSPHSGCVPPRIQYNFGQAYVRSCHSQFRTSSKNLPEGPSRRSFQNLPDIFRIKFKSMGPPTPPRIQLFLVI